MQVKGGREIEEIRHEDRGGTEFVIDCVHARSIAYTRERLRCARFAGCVSLDDLLHQRTGAAPLFPPPVSPFQVELPANLPESAAVPPEG